MKKTSFAAIVSVTLAAAASGALAAPGPNILTTGSADARASMTKGVAHETVSGVNVFRGTPALLGERIEAQEAPPIVEVTFTNAGTNAGCPFRTIRRLRTQGFYSGVPYPSRPFTQGFYSGR